MLAYFIDDMSNRFLLYVETFVKCSFLRFIISTHQVGTHLCFFCVQFLGFVADNPATHVEHFFAYYTPLGQFIKLYFLLKFSLFQKREHKCPAPFASNFNPIEQIISTLFTSFYRQTFRCRYASRLLFISIASPRNLLYRPASMKVLNFPLGFWIRDIFSCLYLSCLL